jgi:hypothetical protein
MEILRFENAPTRKTRSKSPIKGLVGLSAVAAIAVFGSTLAASITLNSGSVEFGQGVSQTTACDSDITVSPTATFVNASGVTGVFRMNKVSFSGVDSTCGGDMFTLQAWGDTSATALQIATGPGNTAISSATVTFNGSTTSLATRGVTVATTSATAFSLTFDTPTATSGAIYKLTLQSGGN